MKNIENKIAQSDAEALREVLAQTEQLLDTKQSIEFCKIVNKVYAKAQKEKPGAGLMTKAQAAEKMKEVRRLKDMLENGELFLHGYEYTDDTYTPWDPDYLTEYADSDGVGDAISFILTFCKDCAKAGYNKEAYELLDWLWRVPVYVHMEEYDGFPADPGNSSGDCIELGEMIDAEIVNDDADELAKLTLYTCYMASEPKKRAENLYRYFNVYKFRELHLEEALKAGPGPLDGIKEFRRDWIALLEGKDGINDIRLLAEAVLSQGGKKALAKSAAKNCEAHPYLYWLAMDCYEKDGMYSEMERVGEEALLKIKSDPGVRSKVALKGAYASSRLGHEDKEMMFCWECFHSAPDLHNYLRLFGTDKMAKSYGLKAKEFLNRAVVKHDVPDDDPKVNADRLYLSFFYTGDLEQIKEDIDKNSLLYDHRELHLMLLYLYANPHPSKAAARFVGEPNFMMDTDPQHELDFEELISEECEKENVSRFWGYFRRWRKYFPMDPEKEKEYLEWMEKHVCFSVDCIVERQERDHYGYAAMLLMIFAEAREYHGLKGAKFEMYARYKKKFPHHRAFLKKLDNYYAG